MKKALLNLGLLVFGFLAWLVYDYFYRLAGEPLDPDSLWQKSQSLWLLFPVVIFAANWYWWRGVAPGTRTLVCLGVSIGLSVLGIGLLFLIGFPLHLASGGYE